MSRLIDADLLTDGKGVFSKFIKFSDDFVAYIEIQDLLKVLKNAPTAFDTEKVVAELEDKFEQTVAEILDKTGSDFTIADFNLKRYSDRICEVVKKGGVE